jgi:hypothetical protein
MSIEAYTNVSYKAVRIFLPVLAGLLIPFLYFVFWADIYPKNPAIEDNSTVFALGIFELVIFPILLILSLLFQLIVIAPIWNNMVLKNGWSRSKLILIAVGMCLIFGVGFGCMIWQTKFGLIDLLISVSIATGIAVVYWTSNLFVLYQLDKSHISYPTSHI